jgi:hypothetical protein
MCRAIREKLRSACVLKEKETEAFSLSRVQNKVQIFHDFFFKSNVKTTRRLCKFLKDSYELRKENMKII